MEPAQLLASLFDRKKMAVIRLFIDQPEREFTLQEVARASRVPLATTYRILGRLKTLQLIEERKIKHLKTYAVAKNELTKYLETILETGQSALDAFVDRVKVLPGVLDIILHGKPGKEKANLLIIGRSVDGAAVQTAVREVQERYHFQIIHLVLDPQQYEQMVSMGLYSGLKKELYKSPAGANDI